VLVGDLFRSGRLFRLAGRALLLQLLLLVLAGAANAASPQRLVLAQSKWLQQTPQVKVWLPERYQQDHTSRYPVLYVLDGDANSELVAGVLNRLVLSGSSHEHIIVALTSLERLRDFAPTVNQDPRGPLGAGGGGNQFLDFIGHELQPAINQRYRTNGFNVLAGHSVAGLLVVHSFQARPELFQAHLAFSPAVWWGARETLAATQKYVMTSRHVQSYLYMAIGSEGGEMRQVYDGLAQTLLRYRNVDLDLRLDVFENDPHDLVMAAGIYSALRGLFLYQQKTMSVKAAKQVSAEQHAIPVVGSKKLH